MINANELRIGNLVLYNDRFQKIYGIETEGFITEFNLLGIRTTQVEPIPLTPEILEKAGFIFDSGIWSMPYGNKCSIDLQVWYDQSIHFVCNSGDTDTEIKHLHHLQNLIHAFTGEEIPIEL